MLTVPITNYFPHCAGGCSPLVELEIVEEYWLEVIADLSVVQVYPLLVLDAVWGTSHSMPMLSVHLVSIVVWL